MTVSFQATIDDASAPQSLTNTVSVTSAQSSEPATASVITEVRTIGLPFFTDSTGVPVDPPSYTLPGTDDEPGEPVNLKLTDADRNTDPN